MTEAIEKEVPYGGATQAGWARVAAALNKKMVDAGVHDFDVTPQEVYAQYRRIVLKPEPTGALEADHGDELDLMQRLRAVEEKISRKDEAPQEHGGGGGVKAVRTDSTICANARARPRYPPPPISTRAGGQDEAAQRQRVRHAPEWDDGARRAPVSDAP